MVNKEKQKGVPEQQKTLHTVPSSASLYGTDIVDEEHRQLVESIARHIVHGKLSFLMTRILDLTLFYSYFSVEKLRIRGFGIK